MLPDKILQLTIPLSPFLQRGETKPKVSKRIRPEDALDLRSSIRDLEPSTLVTIENGNSAWSVVAVYSPYSPDVHVMVIETNVERYLPGPERIPDAEGNALMEIWASILEFISEREQNATIHVGYNWSPRAWGIEEEKTGFQSIPTKWHAMLWGWPQFPDTGEKTETAEWVEFQSLSTNIQRLMGKNTYAEPFGQLIQKRLENAFPEGSQFVELFPPWDWKIDGRGIVVDFDLSIIEILKTAEFFSQVLKPIAIVLEQVMRELTEALTSFDCDLIDNILLKVETGPLDVGDLQTLRKSPDMREIEEVKKIFEERDYPEMLLDAIREPVLHRCMEEGKPVDWWRRGFGYAFVLNGSSKEASGRLRIMPGVFVGPGGVVEAQGVVLRRPENRSISKTEIMRKSRILWELAAILQTQFEETSQDERDEP